MVFNKLDHSSLLASLSILKLRCLLLHENLTVLLAPTNQPPIKCKKIQLGNSLWTNTRWRYAIFNYSQKYCRWRSKGYVQSVCNALMFLYIQFGVSEKAWINIFVNSETVPLNCMCKVLYEVYVKLMSNLKKKERTCLKVLLQLLIIYFLPHQSLLTIFKQKTEPYFVVAIFSWNVFELFQPNFPLMKKAVFPQFKH